MYDDEDSSAWFEKDACNQGYYYFGSIKKIV